MTEFVTSNSTYQVKHEDKLIRRTKSNHKPTVRQGADHEWQPFETISRISIGAAVLIIWNIRQGKATMTSEVTNVYDFN